MRKILATLLFSAVLSACQSTEESAQIPEHEYKVIATQAPAPIDFGFSEIYSNAAQLGQYYWITQDLIDGVFSATIARHITLVEEQKLARLSEANTSALENSGENSSTKLITEMLYSLDGGVMMPVHSREVGKEFSMIYTAEATAQSPTIGNTLDYSLFAVNDSVCSLTQTEMRAYRQLAYFLSLSAEQLAALLLEQSSIANALFAFLPQQSAYSHANAKTCLQHHTLVLLKSTKKATPTIDFAANVESILHELQSEQQKGLRLVNSNPVQLTLQSSTLDEYVLALTVLNKDESTNFLTEAIALFEQLQAMVHSVESGNSLTEQDNTLLNAWINKTELALGEYATPALLKTVQLFDDGRIELQQATWSNAYAATSQGKYTGVKTCVPIADNTSSSRSKKLILQCVN